MNKINQLDGLPQVVEIEVNRCCNLACRYCPQGLEGFRKTERLMPIKLFEKIIGMLVDLDFVGRLSFHHYNEPLLRNDLEKIVKYANSKLRRAYFVLYTNGTLLTENRYKLLITAGIDQFFVTLHGAYKLPEREYQVVRKANSFPISGRGGTIQKTPESWALPCFAPAEMLIIRYDGLVVLCHEDAESKHVMGDLSAKTIKDIWFSENFIQARKLLIDGKRECASSICRICDNSLHPLPDTSI